MSRDPDDLQELLAEQTNSLREKELQFRMTLGPAAIGIAHVALDGHWLWVNQKLCDIVGYTREELLRSTFQDITHPDDLEMDLGYVRQVLSGQIPNYSLEKRYFRKDGSTIWVNLTVSLARSPSGEPDFFLSVVEDITERKQSQDNVSKQKDFLDHVINGMPDPVFVKDEKHRWVVLNDAFCRLVGHSREELIGKSDFDFFPKEEAEVFWEMDNEVFASGLESVNEEELTGADGHHHIISTRKSVFSDPQTGQRTLVGTIRDVTENRLAERDAARLAAIVSSSNDAIISKTLDGVITSWNRGAEALYGYTSDEAIGRSIRFLLPPERAGEGAQLLEKIGRGEHVEHFDTIRLHKNGRLVPVSLNMSPIRDAKHRIVGVSSIARDVSERTRAEKALRESEERFHEAFASAPAGIAMTAPNGRLLDANDTFCGMLGYTVQELTARSFADITHPDDIQDSRNFVQAALRGEVTSVRFDKRYLRKDGTPVWTSVHSRLLRDAAGNPRHFVTHILDISDRKAAEAALQASEGRFRGFVESLLDGFAKFSSVRDKAGRIIDFRYDYINEAGCRLNQITREEQVGRTLLEVLPAHRQSGLFDQYVDVVETGRPMIKEALVYEDVYGGGQRMRRAFDVRAVQVGDGFAVTWRDITERKRTEEEISRLNAELKNYATQLETANKELESFAYSVSHDLRAPLRHLGGFLELLEQNLGTLDDKGRRYFDIILGSVHEMSHLIDDLLGFSRIGRVEMQQTIVNMASLVGIVRDALRPDFAGRSVEWAVGPLPEVPGDPALLKQLLVNLVSNAIKYTRSRAEALIEIGCREEAGQWLFFVRDNGVGFDMRYVHKLFGVFQRLHRSDEFEGTGIGLAIVDRIVRRHGGRIWAEGKVNEGATFFFSLPKTAPTTKTDDASVGIVN